MSCKKKEVFVTIKIDILVSKTHILIEPKFIGPNDLNEFTSKQVCNFNFRFTKHIFGVMILAGQLKIQTVNDGISAEMFFKNISGI